MSVVGWGVCVWVNLFDCVSYNIAVVVKRYNSHLHVTRYY